MAPTPNQVYPRLSGVLSSQDVKRGITFSASVGSAEATETHYIYPEDLQTFVQDVLGYSYTDPLAGSKMTRVLPARHPDLPYLWASGISGLEAVQNTGKRDGFGGNGSAAEYTLYRVTVSYNVPPYNMRSQVTKEHSRYLALEDVKHDVELWPRELGQFRYESATPGAYSNKPIPKSGGAALRVTKTRFTYRWVQVPDVGLWGLVGYGAGGLPANVLNGLGRVNVTDWRNYPAGTLLFEGVKFIPRIMPVNPQDFGQGADEVPFAWDVQLQFVFFDPPTGDTSTGRGHNCVPNPQDNLWYLAVYNIDGIDEGDSQYWRYQTYEFDTIFEMMT